MYGTVQKGSNLFVKVRNNLQSQGFANCSQFLHHLSIELIMLHFYMYIQLTPVLIDCLVTWLQTQQCVVKRHLKVANSINPFTAEFLTNFTVLQKNHYIKSATAYNS